MTLQAGDALGLLRQLVAIDSRNPAFAQDAPGERAITEALAAVLRSWGFRVELQEVAPNRHNVIARIGPTGGRSLMFNGHIDTVDTAGMTHDPFGTLERDGKLYGRGSCDMKGGVAAMCAAAYRAAQRDLQSEIIVTAVADEEFTSLGTQAVVQTIRADAAIVTEPTTLDICPAHRGFTWAEFVFHGRAAHGSRYDLGVDAIMNAGLLLEELGRFEHETLKERRHHLLGRPSLHAATIAGGAGWSTYPDRCTLRVERRTLPGETPEHVMQEFEQICDRIRQREPRGSVDLSHVVSRPPSDVAEDAPVVKALANAIRTSQQDVRVSGMSAWCDTALLNDAGIPAICYGPGNIMLAHADEEYVPLREVEQATEVLTTLALAWASER